MSGAATGWSFKVRVEHGLSPSVGYVLAAYADNADSDGKCWPEKSTIVKKTGYGKSTVYRAIETLETEGLLRFTEDEKGRECAYLALSDVSHSGKTSSQGGKSAGDEVSQPGNGFSQAGNSDSHSGKRSNKGTVSEPSGTKQQNVVFPDSVARLYDFWKQQTGRNGSTRLTPERRRAVQARLDEDRDEAFIRRAIANAAHSPFHQGKNDGKARYDDLTLICRNGSKLEYFAELGTGGKGTGRPADPAPDTPITDPEAADRIWAEAKQRLRSAIPDSTYRLWIEPFEAAGERDGKLVLVDSRETGGGNARQWAERRYTALVLQVLADVGAEYSGVEFVDETQLEHEAR